MAGCRDCQRCTRTGLAKATYALLVGWWIWAFAWMWRGFVRRCPQCRHALTSHARRRDGSFID